MKDMLSDSEDQLHLYGNETLANATNTFHVEIKLGKGGFGSVYKVYQVFVRSFFCRTLCSLDCKELNNSVAHICRGN